MPLKIEILGPDVGRRLGDRLLAHLFDPSWTDLYAAVAYVKEGGVRKIATGLHSIAGTANVRIVVGIDQQGTSLEGLQTLWLLLGRKPNTVFVLHNPGGNPSPTFHPKTWLFIGEASAVLLCGSGNLTSGGLFTNYEFGVEILLDLSDTNDNQLLTSMRARLEAWADPMLPEVAEVNADALLAMHRSGELPTEGAMRRADAVARSAKAALGGLGKGLRSFSGLFAPRSVPPAPSTPSLPHLPTGPVTPKPTPRLTSGEVKPGAGSTEKSSVSSRGAIPSSAITPLYGALVIVVNPRNKTEIFLAKKPLSDDPAFFGWPFLGQTQPKVAGNPGQPQPDPSPTAEVIVYDNAGGVVGRVEDDSLKLWTYSVGKSANDDFRMTLIGGLQKLVPDGSVLVMTREPISAFDYLVELYPPGHPNHPALLAECNRELPGGRRYGWRPITDDR